MQTQQRYYTPEEYLAQEESAEFRNEYRDGEIVSMTGGSIIHNQIAGNVFSLLKAGLRGTSAKPYFGDLRLWIPQYQQYTYPDVFVIQGAPVFQDRRTDTILNPCLIIEILSQSTQNYDRTEKFRYYRSIPQFQEYILVDQYSVAIDQYTRANDQPGNTWLFRSHESETERMTLQSVPIEMSIAAIYEDVDFSLIEN